MKRIPKALYQSADEIDQRIQQLERDALLLRPETDEHRKIMRQIAQLRLYADAKRWLAGSPAQPA
jgi:hypothetical protein